MPVEDAVFLAFTAFNGLQIVSYGPQIAAVARDRHGATAIAYSTWIIWLLGSAATTAYALVNVWDLWLALVNAVHTVCCLAVIMLTAWKRQALRPSGQAGLGFAVASSGLPVPSEREAVPGA